MTSFIGSLFSFVCLVATAIAATSTPPYYIITNAETPSLNRPGLTPVGQQRAAACIPQDNTDMDDLLENVNDAGINDDTVGTQQVSSPLVHWHDALFTEILFSPDVILTVVSGARVRQTSMNCTGLDGPA
ncbi:hypothetical protein GGX14DRAFT_400835 [Mycena pura]|uniref:Uncharacterized protein n=1 Tax=Mycena pura TaxID=153505 RepID=A0AAD6Y921_9AGAR|nr:hypothetical protein GGX14DRAFT_400835 [Mycena pura]